MKPLIRRAAYGAIVSGALGFLLVFALASALLAEYDAELRQAGSNVWAGLDTALWAWCCYLLVVPTVSVIILHLFYVRPAFASGLGSWVLLGLVAMVVQRAIPGGHLQPAWCYGLIAFGVYAVVGALTACFGPDPTNSASITGNSR
jgi:hypothetical protein